MMNPNVSCVDPHCSWLFKSYVVDKQLKLWLHPSHIWNHDINQGDGDIRQNVFFCLPYIWLADQVYILPIFSIPVSLFCNSIKINICTYHVLYQVVSSQYRNQQLYQDNIPLVGWLPEYPIGWFPKYLLSDPRINKPWVKILLLKWYSPNDRQPKGLFCSGVWQYIQLHSFNIRLNPTHTYPVKQPASHCNPVLSHLLIFNVQIMRIHIYKYIYI